MRTLTVPLGPDRELRVRAITDPASIGDHPVVEVRTFYRGIPGNPTAAEWSPSHEGIQVPLYLVCQIADAMRQVGKVAAEHLAFAPPADGGSHPHTERRLAT